MKKLICAAIAAGSMFAMAEECVPTNCAEAAKCAEAAPAAVVAAKPVAKPLKMTDKQRAKKREPREKFMSERRAQTESRILEVVRKYVPEEEKARALAKEVQDAIIPSRRNMTRRPVTPASKPAEVK